MEALGVHSANSAPLTPLGFLDRTVTVYGDCLSVAYGHKTFTWFETRSRCLRLASALKSVLNISTGDVVSVMAPNIPAMYEMHFAVPMSGAVLNNLNLRLDARTLSIMLRHSSSRLVIVDHEYVPVIRQALDLLPQDHNPPLVIPILEQQDNDADSSSLTYESLISSGDSIFHWVRPTSDWTPMVLNYTSGTTSAPKGVVHCHRGLFLTTVNSLLDWGVTKQPVYLWTLPMFHSNGWSFPWGVAALGGTNVCLRRFNAADVYKAIREYAVTHMCAAPVVLNMLANNAPEGAVVSKGCVEILTSGAPPPASVLQRTEALGFRVTHGYGLTETSGVVVSCAWKRKWDTLPATDRAQIKSRQGVRTPAMDEIDVIDTNTGKSVPRDGKTVGEIVFRGGCIMLGYLNDPEATKKVCGTGGWFYTGDLGVMHPDEYIEIKDRSKDVIISGGENISSVEIESVLYTHPAINDVAVVARPDEFWGESPCAFVTLKEKDRRAVVTEEDIVQFCQQRLPRFMVPKTVVVWPELPRSSTGKLQKFTLRNAAKAMGPVPAAQPDAVMRKVGAPLCRM